MACQGMPRHGMAWHALAWHGMACHGVPCHGMALHGMACHAMPWNGMRGGRAGGRAGIFFRKSEIMLKNKYVQNHAKQSRSEIWSRGVVVRPHQLCYGPDFGLF